MIRLSGLVPYKDIDIVYTGLRPGEKLHEELLYDNEIAEKSDNKKIVIAKVREYDYSSFPLIFRYVIAGYSVV
jgi:FlaA1/EpsC-like NDP-sugar epimerase